LHFQKKIVTVNGVETILIIVMKHLCACSVNYVMKAKSIIRQIELTTYDLQNFMIYKLYIGLVVYLG